VGEYTEYLSKIKTGGDEADTVFEIFCFHRDFTKNPILPGRYIALRIFGKILVRLYSGLISPGRDCPYTVGSSR
jgi:hypothetical protein